MEILMKLKCSPAPRGTPPNSTLKVIDHHHQLEQHTLRAGQLRKTHSTAYLAQPMSTAPPLTATSPESIMSNCYDYCCGAVPVNDVVDLRWNSVQQMCDNATSPLSCNSRMTACRQPACCSIGNVGYTGETAAGLPPFYTKQLETQFNAMAAYTDEELTRYEYHEPEENFISIDDVKIKSFLMKMAETDQRAQNLKEEKLKQMQRATTTTTTSATTFTTTITPTSATFCLGTTYPATSKTMSSPTKSPTAVTTITLTTPTPINETIVSATKTITEITSPQPYSVEKFKNTREIIFEIIDLDDENERAKLMELKEAAEFQIIEQQQKQQLQQEQQQQQQEHHKQQQPQQHHNHHQQQHHHHQQQQQQQQKIVERQQNSPNITLIPKTLEVPQNKAQRRNDARTNNCAKENLIAQIDLIDSSDSETEEADQNVPDSEAIDDEDIPFVAAAVSCELEIDDEEDDEDAQTASNEDDVKEIDNDVVILESDDENIEFIDEHEEGVELRWDDLEGQKERQYFECFVCGKKVQSSYNLRRHMMIHTGERPFGCDLCDRRFREFSDLKKHRRRHVNDVNFLCMVCRVNRPTESDPTRCGNCDTKSSVLIAASRLQITSSPENTSQSAGSVKTKKAPSRNLTPAPNPTSPPPPPPPLSLPQTQTHTPASKVLKTAQSNATPPPPPPLPLPHHQPQQNTPVKVATETQVLLDNIPAVHRPSYNQLGVVTRKEFPCPLCQRPFGTRHNLKRHFMIHTGEKPFSCSKCRKPFREFSTLKKHMVTHQRDRWYKCLLCPQKYRDYLEYNEHKCTHPQEEMDELQTTSSSNTTPTPRKRAKASSDDCDDSNDEDSAVEDWLECCECALRFTDILSYTEHLKAHDPSMLLYECYICKRGFSDHKMLVQHMERHQLLTDDNDEK